MITAAERRHIPRKSFAIPRLHKYPLDSPRRVAAAIKYFRENKWRYTAADRKLGGDRIARAWLRVHHPGLTASERAELTHATRRALGL
jgi:Family of unknown function (DUF6582)